MREDKGGIFGFGIVGDRQEKEHYPGCRSKHDSSIPKCCDWETMRLLNIRRMPSCEPPKWKVKISKDSPMRPGETLYLCDYHKNNLALKFDKVERL